MPPEILADLARSQVSIYAAVTQAGELRTRMQMTDVVSRHHIRHGHMVNISKRIMLEGMRADFVEVDRLSQADREGPPDKARHLPHRGRHRLCRRALPLA
jgi:hypothetical protein